jgi:hypothetical protein
VVVLPLKTTTDRGLGKLLPHQQANRAQAHPRAGSFGFSVYKELATVSSGYALPQGRFLRVPHPSATASWGRCVATYPAFVQLACVIHAASVDPEPESNSPWLRFTVKTYGRVL